MAYYSKEVYEGKRRYAEKRNRRDAELIKTLTQEQHDALAQLAEARHEMHSNTDALIRGVDRRSDIEFELFQANTALEKAGLKPIKELPFEECDVREECCTWIIDIDLLIEIDEFDEDRFDEIYYELSEKWAKINDIIEEYLRNIDDEHGTHYAPTGWGRFFW